MRSRRLSPYDNPPPQGANRRSDPGDVDETFGAVIGSEAQAVLGLRERPRRQTEAVAGFSCEAPDVLCPCPDIRRSRGVAPLHRLACPARPRRARPWGGRLMFGLRGSAASTAPAAPTTPSVKPS